MDAMQKIDLLGGKFLDLSHGIGYWVILIIGTIWFVRCAYEKNRNGAIAAFTTSMLMFSGLYLLPYCMNVIRDIFK